MRNVSNAECGIRNVEFLNAGSCRFGLGIADFGIFEFEFEMRNEEKWKWRLGGADREILKANSPDHKFRIPHLAFRICLTFPRVPSGAGRGRS